MNYFVFRSLIRTFAPDFMNMWIDLGCLQPQKKMLKEKTCFRRSTGLSRIPPYFSPHTLLIYLIIKDYGLPIYFRISFRGPS